jgi:hypothetical protein
MVFDVHVLYKLKIFFMVSTTAPPKEGDENVILYWDFFIIVWVCLTRKPLKNVSLGIVQIHFIFMWLDLHLSFGGLKKRFNLILLSNP